MSEEKIIRKTIQIKNSLWEQFQSRIEEIYGTTYKKQGEAIETAITNYVNNIDQDPNEKEELRSNINILEQENTQLKLDQKESQNIIQQLDSQMQHKDNEIQHLNKEVKRLESDNHNKTDELNSLRKQNQEITSKHESEINELNQLNKTLTDENQKLIDEKTTAKLQLNDYKKDIQNINDKEKLMQQNIDKSNKNNDILQKQINDLKEDKKKNLEEIEELKKERKRLQTENNQLTQNLENVETQYEGQLTEYKKLVNRKEHTQEVLNKQQFELNEALKKLEKYSYAMGKLENMSLIDRLFNRIPEEVKELVAAEKTEELGE